MNLSKKKNTFSNTRANRDSLGLCLQNRSPLTPTPSPKSFSAPDRDPPASPHLPPAPRNRSLLVSGWLGPAEAKQMSGNTPGPAQPPRPQLVATPAPGSPVTPRPPALTQKNSEQGGCKQEYK